MTCLPFCNNLSSTYHIWPSPGHFLAIWPSAIACHGQKLPEPGTRPPFVEAKSEARFAWTEPATATTQRGVRKKTPELPSFLDDDQQICLNQIVGRFSLNERFLRLRSPGRCRSPARLPDSQSIWSLQPVPPIFSCRQNYPGGAVIKTLGAGIP